MDRRDFLRTTGIVAAGGTRIVAGKENCPSERVLITSAASPLAQTLADGLAGDYRIRLTERIPVTTHHEFLQCDLGADASTRSLLLGVDTILHVAEPQATADAAERLDYLTRCTYNLLWAAAGLKIRQVVLLSSLELLTSYDSDYKVTEYWKPRPDTEPLVLGKYLAEFVCKEFVREGKIDVITLRLGKVVRAGEVQGRPFDPMWVEERDVVQAVSCAVAAKASLWSVYHIQSDSPRGRFSVAAAKQGLGYNPQFSWE